MKNIFILLLLALQACGQTGPLYHPDEMAPIYVPPVEQSEQESQ